MPETIMDQGIGDPDTPEAGPETELAEAKKENEQPIEAWAAYVQAELWPVFEQSAIEVLKIWEPAAQLLVTRPCSPEEIQGWQRQILALQSKQFAAIHEKLPIIKNRFGTVAEGVVLSFEHDARRPFNFSLLKLNMIAGSLERGKSIQPYLNNIEAIAPALRKGLAETRRELAVLLEHDPKGSKLLFAIVDDAITGAKREAVPGEEQPTIRFQKDATWEETLIRFSAAESKTLRDALRELILNAQVELTGDPHGEIVVSVVHIGDELRITVHDNGVKIPVENRPRLFEPYFSTRKEKKGGSGLGLAQHRSNLVQQFSLAPNQSKSYVNLDYIDTNKPGNDFFISIADKLHQERTIAA